MVIELYKLFGFKIETFINIDFLVYVMEQKLIIDLSECETISDIREVIYFFLLRNISIDEFRINKRIFLLFKESLNPFNKKEIDKMIKEDLELFGVKTKVSSLLSENN